MKKVIKFVRGKKDEKKEIAGGITPSQSGDLISPAQTPENEKFLGPENSLSGYVVSFSGKDKTLTKLHKAAWQGNLEKLKSAFKKVEVDAGDRHNRTALHYAVVQGHPNIVWFLLGNNAKTSICDDEGCTPLLKAIECGHKECLKLLLDRGADVNVADYTGNTALHVAVKQGSLDIVSGLLEKGVETDVSNNLGDYPLHIATKAENKELVDLLLDSGAEVNVLDRENRTPLMLAAKNGNLTLTEVFFERGAQLEIVDSNGWTAEDYALLSGHENVASALKTLSEGKNAESKNDQETKPTADLSSVKKEEKSLDSWDESQSNGSEKNVTKKVKEFLRKTSKEETETARKEEDVSDSPNAQATPPYCQPPRSWEMIQAGMIDENKSGSETKRLSLTALGTLRSRRESFTESLSTTSPKFTLSLNRRKGAKDSNSFAKQRLSFNEETSLGNWLTDGSAKDVGNTEAKEEPKGKPSEMTSEEENLQSEEKKNDLPKSNSPEESESESNSIVLPLDSEETKNADDEKANEIANSQPSLDLPQEHQKDTSNGWDSEESFASHAKESNFPPPPTALELGVDMAKSLKYMRGISEDRSGVEAEGKANWKTAHESHSLDLLDDKNVAIGGTRIQQPFKGHFRHQSTSSQRWKSQEIPKLHKPVDRLVDANRRINEQLECYDQALRELAEDEGSVERISKPVFKKVSSSFKHHSLPSPKMKIFNEGRKAYSQEMCFESSSVPESTGEALAAPPSPPPPPSQEKWENNEKLGLETAGETKEASEATENAQNQTERKTKRHMLMAMREVKHAIQVPAAFKTSLDDQILSPLTMPEDGTDDGDDRFGSKEKDEKPSPDEGNLFFALGRQETVVEKREGRSSGSDTDDEATTWHKNDFSWKEGEGGRRHSPGEEEGSEEEASEISEERIHRLPHHQRTSSFSPLGIIYREIQIENQREAETKAEMVESHPSEISVNRDGCDFRIVGSYSGGEEEESKGERSPDISLSSGPIEPLGTEKDSGSEAESSHNDITPTHQYSLKNQQEWLKRHLKTATTEKNKLEEIAAQLLEKAERLQYELADAKEATKSRDEVIKLLQEQLARMEAAYTKSLEESVRSKLQLTSHEQEILHLKEICYKYVEDSRGETMEGDAFENSEKLEIRIKKLEEEKEKMKEEIVQLEEEKTSLVKRLKELTESEIIDQCQRWKERCEKQERRGGGGREGSGVRFGGSGDSEDAREIVGIEREKQLQESNLRLEKRLLEMTEENMELRSNLRRLTGEMESEKKIMDARKESDESIGELRRKNAEVEAYAKRLEKEIDEKNARNLKEREKEVRFLMKQFSREKESLVEVYEKKLRDKRSDEHPEETWKRENEGLKEMMKNLGDRIDIAEKKCCGENAKDSLKADLVELKNQCDLIWKSLEAMQSKDHRDLGHTKKENADPKEVSDEVASNQPREVASHRASDSGEKGMESESENVNMKNVILDLKNQVNSLTLLLGASRHLGTDSNSSRRDSSDSRERQRQEEGTSQRGTATRRKGVGMEDHLAWSNLYGIKSSERMRGAGSWSMVGGWKLDGDADGEERVEVGKENGGDSTEMEKTVSLDKLELIRLRREIGFLQSKMSDERALRRSLEIQMDEINRDLREKQNLEREVHSLKKKIDRDCVRKSDLELAQYQKELEEKREKYLKEVGEKSKMSDDDFKAKCQILAKEREKSKEIKNKIWSKTTKTIPPTGNLGGQPFPVSQHHGFSSGSVTEPEAVVQPQYLTLEPEIKNQLEKELDKSIQKHKAGSSPTRSTSGRHPNLLKE